MTSVRIFFVGGLISFRALFNWLNPWILVPTLLVTPICQILLFAYIGRAAKVGNDEFYVLGNALNYAGSCCLFAMGSTIGGERQGHTLSVVLSTPARRIPLFLGRAAPVVLLGWGVALVSLLAGVLLLDTSIPWATWPALLFVVVVASGSCTALGVAMGAVALRVRESAVMANVIFLVLLVFCGVNVALVDLPGWMASVGRWLPLTHAIEATRLLADGATLWNVRGLLGRELAIGGLYTVLGLLLLRYFENESRRHATLDRV